jgi:hypothetical protein
MFDQDIFDELKKLHAEAVEYIKKPVVGYSGVVDPKMTQAPWVDINLPPRRFTIDSMVQNITSIVYAIEKTKQYSNEEDIDNIINSLEYYKGKTNNWTV